MMPGKIKITDPDNSDLIRYKTLADLSKSKRSNQETQEMYELEEQLEQSQKRKYQAEVDARLAEVYNELKPPGDFNYQTREEQADQLRNVGLPPAERITPDTAVTVRENLNAARIQAQSLYAQAMRRSRILKDVLDILESIWRNRTVQDSEWRANAGAADILAKLRKEVSRASAHAEYCKIAVNSVEQTNLNLRWIMEDKFDRDVTPTL